MAPEWEIDFGMGMGAEGKGSQAPPTGFYAAAAPPYFCGIPAGAETLRIDDLLDFTNHDLFPSSSCSSVPADAAHLLPLPEFSAAAGCGQGPSFPDDIYIPSEEAAELEWLSKFVEDSFSDVPYGPYQSMAAETLGKIGAQHRPEASATGRGARSKRNRAAAVSAGDNGGRQPLASAWSSLTPSSSSTTSSSSSSEFPTPKAKSAGTNVGGRKNASAEAGVDGGVRRCTHCASEKTPQWRTGPLGPKTLCNACGVRYKSGRLVPEYRPAASPTFVLTQHSNSHRKVMELRRQKELLLLRHHENATSSASFPSVGGGASPFSAAGGRPEMLFHDYEVC
ncbi:GATA transcription factor 2 [Apostasia shenzhenica]|uniref:GATA transcription factor 2 n=1 Tax=Apostasia shenzhenica TaxID=1088818 RepID=A0A2H9ZT43_9ASPA|nr:GATA transcription factor 2 [Apostasia shenzhenica]